MMKLEDLDALLAAPDEEESPVVVTAAELGEWLGLTPNRVHALGRDGILPRVDGTRYQLRPAILAYCEHARQLARGKQVDAELAAEKLRLAKANAEKAETANAKARGELIPAVEVEREWAAVLRGVRAAMLALPSRVAQRLGHLSPHDVAEIDREVRDALMELADD